MKVLLFAIYDRKASIYMAPFVARSTIDATRQIAASMRDPQIKETPVGQHPEDFDLFHVGGFDDESGVLAPLTMPALVAPVLAIASQGTGST